jgi:structural maintenance of chromosome 4
MKAAFASDGVTQDQVDQLEACLSERRQAMRQLTSRQSELGSERSAVLDKLSRNEALLIKAETICANLPVELKDLEAQLPNLRKSSSLHLSKAEQTRLKDAEGAIKTCESKLTSLRSDMAPVEAAMASIQAQIMEAGGIRFKAQKSKVDSLKDQIEHQSCRSKKLAVQQASFQSRLESLELGDTKQKGSASIETELTQVESKIEELTQLAVQVGSRIEQATTVLVNFSTYMIFNV